MKEKNNKKTDAINTALDMLRDNGYLCLRPYIQPDTYNPGVNIETKTTEDQRFIGKIIDCEANGLHLEAKPFEVGVVTFEYDYRGIIYRIVETKLTSEDIKEEFARETTVVTGKTLADVKGQQFDEEFMNRIFEYPGIVIAHNAAYDRPKLEKRFPILQRCAWGCSKNDINWLDFDIVETKLILLAQLYGFHFQAHGALSDALATLEILAQPLPGKTETAFQILLQNAKKLQKRVYVIDAPYEKKEQLRSMGFIWNRDGDLKAHYKDIDSSELDVLKKMLSENIYGYPLFPNMLAYADITARNKYSQRIQVNNKYLRHRMLFGKYKDRSIQEIAAAHPDYLQWALGEMDLEKDMRYTFRYHLGLER